MNSIEQKVYAIRSKDEAIRLKSRSGGFFYTLSKIVISNGGVVYGCMLDDSFKAIHIKAVSMDDVSKLRGSKYVQSSLGDIFKSVKNDLQSGVVVLFSGTPCQIAGLKKYLGLVYDNLICVDLICYGVPSPMVFADYLSWQEKRNKDLITSVDFRNKADFGWRNHIETISFQNRGKKSSRYYANLFYSNLILRPCCYECKYKSTNRMGDISIGDFLGIENVFPNLDDDKGVSLLLINTDIGRTYFDSCKNEFKYYETELCFAMQPSLISPFRRPKNRDIFWKSYYINNFSFNIQMINFVMNVKNIMRKIKRNINVIFERAG